MMMANAAHKMRFFSQTMKITQKNTFPTHTFSFNKLSFNFQSQTRSFYKAQEKLKAKVQRQTGKSWNFPQRIPMEVERTSEFHHFVIKKQKTAPFILSLGKNKFFWLVALFFGLAFACYVFSDREKTEFYTERLQHYFRDFLHDNVENNFMQVNSSSDNDKEETLNNNKNFLLSFHPMSRVRNMLYHYNLNDNLDKNDDNDNYPIHIHHHHMNNTHTTHSNITFNNNHINNQILFLFGGDEENELVKDLEIDENFGISNFVSDIFEMDNFGSRVIKYRVWEQNKNQIMKMISEYISDKLGTEITVEKKTNAKLGKFQFEGVKIFRTEDYSKENNCANFSFKIEKVKVNTSVLHFILGKGFITSLELEGVSGFFDRKSVHWSEEELANYRKRSPTFGDFEFKNFEMKDVNIELFHPYPNRPLNFKIDEFKSNLFRQNWLIYDLFTAESMKGCYDGSEVFIQNYQDSNLNLNKLRFEGLNYDNLTSGYPETHPLSWVTNGKINVEFSYQIPNSVCVFRPIDEDLFASFVIPEKDCYRLNSVYPMFYRVDQDFMDFGLKMDLLYLEAEVPKDHSLINNTIYNMIAYYSKNTEIPINVSFSIPLSDFNGALYPYDIRLFENCGNAIYNNFYQSLVTQFVKISFRNLWVSGLNSIVYAYDSIKSLTPDLSSSLPTLAMPLIEKDLESMEIANIFDQS